MNGLLVLSTLAAASAQVVLPYGGLAYGGLGYHGLGYAGYPYAVAKPVVNEVEVPVPVVQYAAIDTPFVVHCIPTRGACQGFSAWPVCKLIRWRGSIVQQLFPSHLQIIPDHQHHF